MTNQTEAKSSIAVVALAWLLVGLPLLWGVSQTLLQTAQLFK